MRSMTGFGTGTVEYDEMSISVTVRSVNHKSLDVRTSTSVNVGDWDMKSRARIKEVALRGRVDVRIAVEAAGSETGLDAGLDRWVSTLRAFKRKHGLEGVLSVHDVLSTWSMAETTNPHLPTWDEVLPALDQAVDAWIGFRQREGTQLKLWFIEQLAALSATIEVIDERRPAATRAQRERLQDRVSTLLDGADLDVRWEERIEAEIVMMAERADIEEEVQRATTHIDAAMSLIADPTFQSRGRRLDFLLQELIRETNTMASKSTDSEIRALIVNAKTLVDRMREQAANVE